MVEDKRLEGLAQQTMQFLEEVRRYTSDNDPKIVLFDRSSINNNCRLSFRSNGMELPFLCMRVTHVSGAMVFFGYLRWCILTEFIDN